MNEQSRNWQPCEPPSFEGRCGNEMHCYPSLAAAPCGRCPERLIKERQASSSPEGRWQETGEVKGQQPAERSRLRMLGQQVCEPGPAGSWQRTGAVASHRTEQPRAEAAAGHSSSRAGSSRKGQLVKMGVLMLACQGFLEHCQQRDIRPCSLRAVD